MDRENVTKAMEVIFQEVLNPTIVLTDDLDANKVPEWDSLNHITLIVEIESKFGIELTTSELAGLLNVGDMIDLIMKKVSRP